ncbi:hypothetical protein RYA05_04660 [Pseudomonas syringae pv. actinidiae]|nr:hypothetical protein [Pseudomonas syringae pv. actinidiae]
MAINIEATVTDSSQIPHTIFGLPPGSLFEVISIALMVMCLLLVGGFLVIKLIKRISSALRKISGKMSI